jgi:Cu(I)/Ag(I) efflux system membrane fusion protein
VNRKSLIGLALAIVIALAAGYWWGSSSVSAPHRDAAPALAGGTSDADTMQGAEPSRRILYYRNPMGLADTSPVPKKDSMGMDYIPVYEGDEPDGPQVKISLGKLQKLGVRAEVAASREMRRTIRAVGTVVPSERTLHVVSPRFEGWVTRLYVNTTGATVKRGQPLLEVYSPDLVSAQEEYRAAWQSLQAMGRANDDSRANMQALVDGSLQRLRNWEIADAEIDSLRTGGPVRTSMVLRSRVDGIVMKRMAVDGMRFMPGETLFEIADLSHVWLMASVFEQDLGLVRTGQPATASFTAYPGRTFDGELTFVYPTVEAATRTGQVRIELPNATGLLKPDLYGTVNVDAGLATAAVAIPESAVLDSGTRQAVLIELGGGVFEPREITLGLRGDGYVEVLKGIEEGERVVVNGNFLIDAESNFKAALGALGGHAGHGGGDTSSEDAMEPAPRPREPAEASSTANEHAGH